MQEMFQNADEGDNQHYCLVETDLYNLFAGYKAGGKLLSSIERAKKSIKIASPFVSSDEIELLREKILGKMTNIKIITTADEKLENLAQIYGLKALIHRERMKDSSLCEYTSIIDAVFFKGNFFHAKFYIIDDDLAFVGSLNFTGKGCEKSIETCITFKDINTIQKLSSYFDYLFTVNKRKWDVAELGKIVYDTVNNYVNK